MFSSSNEVYDVSISWNYFQLSMTDNFCLGKWAKIERNDSKLLPGRLKSITSENSELVNQDARIVRASPISFFEVARYDCLPHRFSHKHKNWKESDFQLVFEPVFFFNFFSYGYILLFHNCPLAENTRHLYEIFLYYLIR